MPPAPDPNAAAAAEALRRAVGLHQAGRLEEAGQLYRQILGAQPRHFDALHLLGVIEKQKGNDAEAVRLIGAALEVDPRSPAARVNLGLALYSLGRHEEAIAGYDKAIALESGNAEAWFNRGNALRELKRREQALASYEQALRLRPDHFGALNNRGSVLHSLGRNDEALASYDRAIALHPDQALAYNNRGAALEGLARFDEALASYDKAVALEANYADAHLNRGNMLQRLGRLDEAVSCYERAAAPGPRRADALYSRGLALKKLRRFGEAQSSCAQALSADPGHADALALLFEIKGRCCDWSDRGALLEALTALCAAGRPVAPFVLLWAVDSPELHLEAARAWARDALPELGQPAAWPARTHPRMRIAYVSADFQTHATAHLMAGLFERHDRNRFEIHAISLRGSDGSRMRHRLEAAFDRFVDVAGRSDRQIAQLLRDLEIDIAVDLKGYTEDSRPGIFSFRPAPIAVSYLGYPGTMGSAAIDYVVADACVIPEDATRFYAERVVRLPDSYQVNDSGRPAGGKPPARAELGLPEDGFVFCSFNNNYKITPEVFDAWMRLLRAVDGSVLWLYAENEPAARNLAREAEARGIAPRRLVFAAHVAVDQHLSRIRRGDLFLDTLPYNAHTTTSDALWAGVPVVTCSGRSFAARVAGSLLTAAGLPELITHSLQEYEAMAMALATDRKRLGDIKAKLAANRDSCALFDTDRFRRHIEAAYTVMWERHQRGEGARDFTVRPVR